MPLTIVPQAAPCGATVYGIDLRQPLPPDTVAELRQTWLQHQVLAFPDQDLSLEDLERIALHFGPFGSDPYFGSVPGHPHIAQVRRDADETTQIFAETWHSDWSFLPRPPQATLLYGNVIPPVGGDTLFANQYAAWDALSPAMKTLLQDKQGIHSARRGYARDGMYGEKDKGRSMAIKFDDSALATQLQPIARVHPETGRTALYVSPGYTIGIEGMPDARGPAAVDGAVPPPGARGFRLPPPLAAGHAADVGQPLRDPCRNRRLRRPRAAAAPHHAGRTRSLSAAAAQSLGVFRAWSSGAPEGVRSRRKAQP